ncbi:SDR family oxidoreductase [Actibacterium sp. 188UL27-1]|uniref:SDR family NAD(P)-dependent oxidoreductase n=1 Tax=Actibacterium sp. 188UL27-1 TaxID=2786961 RepID=UPI001959A788|nr:SDR family oxidoreductase [Actibacterium sp. 188UL27-1]MBM7068014.1 SDR family oxidoreductase [Actibacterium sp. 188UL27-1]
MDDYTLVTGASDGIGRALARIAAKRGRNVILTARSKDKLTQLAEELKAAHDVEAIVIPTDLSQPGEAARLWSEASDGRRIEILINNAGLGRNGPFAEGEWAREERSMAVNMTALTVLMKQAVPHMIGHGDGRILNVASVAGFLPGPNMAVYHATKAYVLSLSEAVAEELRGTKVSVTALCPSATKSNFFNDAGMHDIMVVNSGMVANADKVAMAGWNAMVARQRIVVPGAPNAILAALPRITPRAVVTRIAAKFLS